MPRRSVKMQTGTRSIRMYEGRWEKQNLAGYAESLKLVSRAANDRGREVRAPTRLAEPQNMRQRGYFGWSKKRLLGSRILPLSW